MPYDQVLKAEKHGVRIGLDISAVVFVNRLTKNQGEEDPSLGLMARSLYPNNGMARLPVLYDWSLQKQTNKN